MVLSLSGVFGPATRELLASALHTARSHGGNVIRVDVSGVTAIDAACLDTLRDSRRSLADEGRALRLVRASDAVAAALGDAGELS